MFRILRSCSSSVVSYRHVLCDFAHSRSDISLGPPLLPSPPNPFPLFTRIVQHAAGWNWRGSKV